MYRQGSSTLLCALFPLVWFIFILPGCCQVTHLPRWHLQSHNYLKMCVSSIAVIFAPPRRRCCVFSLCFSGRKRARAPARPPAWCRLSACEVLLACSLCLDVRHIDQSFASVLCASIVSSKSGRGGFSAQKKLFFLSYAFLFGSSLGLKSHLLYRLCWNSFFLSFLSSSWICILFSRALENPCVKTSQSHHVSVARDSPVFVSAISRIFCAQVCAVRRQRDPGHGWRPASTGTCECVRTWGCLS